MTRVQFSMELRPGVKIQSGIKTRGRNSTGIPHVICQSGRYTITPVSGGGGSQFNMKSPLNAWYSLLNSDPTDRNSMGSKFNLTTAVSMSSGVLRLIFAVLRTSKYSGFEID